MTTGVSDLGLAFGPLDLTGAPRSDAHKERIHAALFDGRPLPPEHFGRFVLRGTLGRGAMGTVLEAYDAVLHRKLALKVLHPTLNERPSRRLLREAQALAKLSHPNVVQVYEVGEVEGRTFIAMELVRGRMLQQWQQQERPEWRACVEAYLQAGQGLAAAHAAGLVHRDFKPHNCILDEDGRVRVLDFGLVRGAEGGSDEGPSRVPPQSAGDQPFGEALTRTDAMVGTVAYMSLEQLEGGPVDARSDQFSFCVSLYEALYGERPFGGDSLSELATALKNGEVRRAPAGTRVPGKLRSVLLRGLSADPGARWPSMTALLTELRHVVAPRIQIVSKVVKLVSFGLFWACLIGGVVGIATLVMRHDRMDPWDGIFFVALYSSVSMVVMAAVFHQIARLAELYEQGQLFTAANVRHLRAIGLLVTSLSVGVGPVFEAGAEVLTAALDFRPTAAMAGLLVVFVSWVMDEARMLARAPR